MKKLFCILLSLLLALTPMCVFADGITKVDNENFTLLWTTDPQWYSFAYPEILTHQNDWVVDNCERLGIEYILHTGDFVDLPDKTEQWQTVTAEYAKWDDAGIPYGVLAGNHDVSGTDYSAFSSYFGASRYKNNAWYGGDYQNNKGHFDLLTLGGVDFLFLYMGYGTPADADIAWMNSVLEQHSDRIAFLMFHEFLDAEGNRTAVGETYFERVVLPNANVRMVLCGHNYTAARRSDSIDDNGDGTPDRTVHQLIANYQDTPKGGNGYMRFMEFDTQNGTVLCRTYSPYLDDFNYFENDSANMDIYGWQDEFTLDFDFSAPVPASANSKVVSDPYAACFDLEKGTKTVFAIDLVNQAPDASFAGVGLYDHTFSLCTDDIAENAAFVIASYDSECGYVITDVTEENTVISERSVVLALFGQDAPSVSVGQTLALARADGLASPASETPVRLYLYDRKTVFGIDAVGGVSPRFAIHDRTMGENVTAGADEALFIFEPLAEHAGVYTLTQAFVGQATLVEGGFALKTDLRGHSKTYRDSLADVFFVGVSAALDGYIPETGMTLSGESILSKDPADWVYDQSVMIVEQTEDALVLSNNNGLWPDGTYTLETPMTIDPKTAGLYYDFTIQNGGKTSILLQIGSQYVKLNSHFAGVTISESSGDVKGNGNAATGTLAFADLPIPENCFNDDGTVTLYGMQIYACGTANLTTSYRELRVIADMSSPVWPDYTPPVREETSAPTVSEESVTPSQPTETPAPRTVWFVAAGVVIVLAAAAAIVAVRRT